MALVSVDGAPVESVSAVDPATTAVAMVVDDRPEVTAESVGAAQGAALEVARNVAEEFNSPSTRRVVSSGVEADRNAAIARISGITAGAPDVVPIDEAIAAAAEELASSPLPDRHLLVSLGAPVTLDAAQQAELTADLDNANARLHLLTPGAAPELTNVAVASGGLAPAMTQRWRPPTGCRGAHRPLPGGHDGVGSGSHEVALEVGGTRYTAPINVALPRAVPPPTSPPATPAPTTVAPTAAAAPPTTARRAASTTEAPTSTARAAPAPLSCHHRRISTGRGRPRRGDHRDDRCDPRLHRDRHRGSDVRRRGRRRPAVAAEAAAEPEGEPPEEAAEPAEPLEPAEAAPLPVVTSRTRAGARARAGVGAVLHA